uniref:BHLH domain-containing protein n=1 Tax=Panagrolaimus superbus TaxID=310955 RepID=A0A914ZC52_9BILA
MEEFSTSIGLPTLSATTPFATINFGLPASMLQLYHTNTPVNTNELTIYHPEGNTPKGWQTIHPTMNPFVPHPLPDPPKDLLELQNDRSNISMTAFPGSVTSQMDIDMIEAEQPLPRPIPTRPFNNYCRSPSSEQSDHSESNNNRKLSQSSSPPKNNNNNKKKPRNSSGGGGSDDRAERRKKGNTESQARSREHNKIIKGLYELNDKLIDAINQEYLKNGNHNDPLINKLLTEYERLPKKQRPYKKRTPSSSIINEIA